MFRRLLQDLLRKRGRTSPSSRAGSGWNLTSEDLGHQLPTSNVEKQCRRCPLRGGRTDLQSRRVSHKFQSTRRGSPRPRPSLVSDDLPSPMGRKRLRDRVKTNSIKSVNPTWIGDSNKEEIEGWRWWVWQGDTSSVRRGEKPRRGGQGDDSRPVRPYLGGESSPSQTQSVPGPRIGRHRTRVRRATPPCRPSLNPQVGRSTRRLGGV